jgi:hypothetical protein
MTHGNYDEYCKKIVEIIMRIAVRYNGETSVLNKTFANAPAVPNKTPANNIDVIPYDCDVFIGMIIQKRILQALAHGFNAPMEFYKRSLMEKINH